MVSQLAEERPDRVAARLEFSERLAHRIEAGSDMFVMPSRYEPCGLNQLYSLRYGTVPVVHATGGLADTICDATPATFRHGVANGFSFAPYEEERLDEALRTRHDDVSSATNRLGPTRGHRNAARLVLATERPPVYRALRIDQQRQRGVVLDPQIAQIRRAPLTGETILMATDRVGRPNDFEANVAANTNAENCPFCPQNEHLTIEPRFDYRLPGEGAEGGRPWASRAVPNLYPAIDPVLGLHRVIVESPRHVMSWLDLTPEERTCALLAYQDQFLLSIAEGYPYAQIFKNCGPHAGASLTHCHSQMIANSQVPDRVQREVLGASAYYHDCGCCFYCELAEGVGASIVTESEGFVAVCPHASRFPFETWVLPRDHAARFDGLDVATLVDLGAMLADVAEAFDRVLPQAAYNLAAAHGAGGVVGSAGTAGPGAAKVSPTGIC